VATESVVSQPVTIAQVRVDDERITVVTTDGREHSVPLAWSLLLSAATPEQRANYELQEFGTAIHWPDVDEDLGLATFLGVDEDVVYDALGFDSAH
jgi:hypothetical protein